MGIIRGGDTEYEENKPTLEELSARVEEAITVALEAAPTTLKLSGRYYSKDEVTLLVRSPQVSSVRNLDLSDNQIDDSALQVLIESEKLQHLEELNLGLNFLTDEGVKAWAGSENVVLKNLKTLVLSDNKLTDESLAHLVQSPNFPVLESLDVGWMGAGNGTARALGGSNAMICLKQLTLERSYIDGVGIRALVQGKIIERLEELNLTANKLGDEGAKILAGTSNLKNLRVLHLSQNMIGDEGAVAIGASTGLRGLTHLYLGRNNFGSEGAKAVHETQTLTHLKTLILQEGVETTPDLVNYSRPELLRPDQ